MSRNWKGNSLNPHPPPTLSLSFLILPIHPISWLPNTSSPSRPNTTLRIHLYFPSRINNSVESSPHLLFLSPCSSHLLVPLWVALPPPLFYFPYFLYLLCQFLELVRVFHGRHALTFKLVICIPNNETSYVGVKFVSYQSEMYHSKGHLYQWKGFLWTPNWLSITLNKLKAQFQPSGKSKRNNIKAFILHFTNVEVSAGSKQQQLGLF